MATIELMAPATSVAAPGSVVTMPAPLWRGADRMVLSCAADTAAAAALGPGWCAVVLAEARRGAAMPVSTTGNDDPLRSALLLDVTMRDGAIVLTVARAFPIDESESSFRRRGPALPQGNATDPRVRAAFAAALDSTLPWRRAAPPPGVRSRRPATTFGHPVGGAA